MKKLLIMALLSLISTLSYSNNTNDTLPSKIPETILKSVSDSSALTFKEVYSDVKEGLKGLSGALKVGTEHVYEVLVKQQYVNAFIYLILLIISLLLWIPIGMLTRYNIKNNWDFEGFVGLSVIGGIVSLVFNIITFCNIDIILTGFINPEYGAIQDIMHFINK